MDSRETTVSKASKDWRSQLFTHEDRFGVHKILGVAVLMSYACRFLFLLVGDHDLGFQRFPEWTFPTLLLHISLNLSSFMFRIPSKRICNGDSRIWPEYRLHSLVFLSRSLAVIALHNYNIGQPQHPKIGNYLLVMGNMLAGDVCSASVQRPSRSIRDLAAPPAVKLFFSAMQLLLTAAILVGFPRDAFYFYTALVIQVTPFLMTLRRKNIVTHSFNVFVYGGLLLVGSSLGLYEVSTLHHGLLTLYIISLLGCTAIIVRIMPLFPIHHLVRNKYILWTLLFGLLEGLLRPLLVDDLDNNGSSQLVDKDSMIVAVSFIAWVEMLTVVLYAWRLCLSQKK